MDLREISCHTTTEWIDVSCHLTASISHKWHIERFTSVSYTTATLYTETSYYHATNVRLYIELGQKPAKGWKWKRYHGMWVGMGCYGGLVWCVRGREKKGETQKHAFRRTVAPPGECHWNTFIISAKFARWRYGGRVACGLGGYSTDEVVMEGWLEVWEGKGGAHMLCVLNAVLAR